MNLPLLWGSALAVAIVAAGGHFWHARQAARNALRLLAEADEHERAEEWLQAVQSLRQFSRLRPDAAEARLRMARAFDHLADAPAAKSQALGLYAAAAAAAPQDREIRARHLELLLEVGDPDGALARADELLQSSPADPDALRAKALALDEKFRLKAERSAERVFQALLAANRAAPGDPAVAIRLARFYRQTLGQPEASERQKLADDVMNALVESSENKIEAFVSRHAYRVEFDLPGAADDLERAVAADVGESDPTVALAAGRAAMQEKRWPAAQRHFERACELRPQRAEGYLLLGQVHQAQGDAAQALKAWQRGLDATGGDDLNLQAQIAAAQIAAGRHGEVAPALERMEKQIAWLFGPEQTAWYSVLYALRADVALAHGQDSQAIPLLRRILSLRKGDAVSESKAASDSRVYAQLGDCYARLRSWDQAAAAYQNAADLQPRNAAPRLTAGRLWEQAGWLEEAARQYEQAVTIAPDDFSARAALADVTLRRQLLLPAASRDWRPFNDSLAAARQIDPESALVRLLAAESLLAQERPDQAAELFRAAEGAALDAPELAGRLAFDYERMGASGRADAVVERMRSAFGESAGLALIRARLLVRRRQEAKGAEELLHSLSRVAPQQRGDLRYQLALLHAGRNDVAAARAELAQMSAESPGDPRPIQLSIELDLQAGRLPDARERIARLQALEQGREDAGWRYYLGQTLIAEAFESEQARTRKPLVDRAGELAQELEALRPRWAPAYLLKARLALAKAKPDEGKAIQAYAQALRLGERRSAVYQELVSLLFKQNRIAEADAYLEQLRQMQGIPPSLVAMAVAADVWEGNLPRAIETARRDLEQRPRDAFAHLRLGQLLALADSNEPASHARSIEAEAELKRARDLAPDDPRGWSALLSFYRQAGQVEPARGLLAEVERAGALAEADRPFFLAQGFALLGDRETAAAHYRRAADAAADRPAVLIQAAQFFWRSEPARAERYLRQAAHAGQERASANRLLALFLASRGRDQRDLDEAWKLVESNPAGDEWDAADRRLKAMLRLQQGGAESREQARQALQAIVADASQTTAADHLLLARLYEAQSQFDKAREQLAALADRQQSDPNSLAVYADYLLRISGGQTESLDKAGKLLDQLANLEPEAAHFRSFALRARWLGLLRRESEVPEIGRQLLAGSKAPADRPALAALTVQVAAVYASLGLAADAEGGYRNALKLDESQYSPFAIWLAGQDRAAEAVELCLAQAQADGSSRPAIALAAALTAVRSLPENRGRAEQLIEHAMRLHPSDRELLFTVAAMRSMHGDNDGAIELLRLALKLAPNDAAALNNLAIVLCETPAGGDEALKCIDRALETVGHQPDLLDTKGWVLLRQRREAQAEALFRDALFRAPGNPKFRFHLALCLSAQGDAGAAQEAIEQAERDGLAAELLTPAERAELPRLARRGT